MHKRIFILSLLIMLISTFVVVPTPESSSQPDTPKVVMPVPVANEVDKNSIKLDSMVDITVNKTAIIKKQNEEIQKLLIEKGKTRAASTAVANNKIVTKVDTCVVVVTKTIEKDKRSFIRRLLNSKQPE